MARINLLPWREELRKQQQQEFVVAIGFSVLVTAALLGCVHMYLQGLQDYQDQRNKIILDEIAILDTKIKEIKDIEEKKNKLLTKIDVIQELQESRPEIVHLFDELSTTAPEGIYLTKFSQSGNGLTMNGKAQSNARVSAYMRAIDASPWLKTPRLNVIQSKDKTSNSQLSDFTMVAVQGKTNFAAKGGIQQ